jgi:hypothetical protein
LFDAFQKARGGITGLQRNADDFATAGANCFVIEKIDFARGDFAPAGENVGRETGDEFARSRLVVEGDEIDGGEAIENFGTFRCWIHGCGFAAGFDTGVTLHANDEKVAEVAGVFEQANVSGMEQIEGADGADDSLSVAFPFTTLENQIGLGHDRQFWFLRHNFRIPREANPTQPQLLILACAPETHRDAR